MPVLRSLRETFENVNRSFDFGFQGHFDLPIHAHDYAQAARNILANSTGYDTYLSINIQNYQNK